MTITSTFQDYLQHKRINRRCKIIWDVLRLSAILWQSNDVLDLRLSIRKCLSFTSMFWLGNADGWSHHSIIKPEAASRITISSSRLSSTRSYDRRWSKLIFLLSFGLLSSYYIAIFKFSESDFYPNNRGSQGLSHERFFFICVHIYTAILAVKSDKNDQKLISLFLVGTLCSRLFTRKAIEKASQSQEFTDALGEPIVRGPWHAASLAVGRRRETVSCKFPVSGPKGNAILKIKAVSTGGWKRHMFWFRFRLLAIFIYFLISVLMSFVSIEHLNLGSHLCINCSCILLYPVG